MLMWENIPDSKVHGANMGPIWDRQYPGGPHVGPMDFPFWDDLCWNDWVICLMYIRYNYWVYDFDIEAVYLRSISLMASATKYCLQI